MRTEDGLHQAQALRGYDGKKEEASQGRGSERGKCPLSPSYSPGFSLLLFSGLFSSLSALVQSSEPVRPTCLVLPVAGEAPTGTSHSLPLTLGIQATVGDEHWNSLVEE